MYLLILWLVKIIQIYLLHMNTYETSLENLLQQKLLLDGAANDPPHNFWKQHCKLTSNIRKTWQDYEFEKKGLDD